MNNIQSKRAKYFIETSRLGLVRCTSIRHTKVAWIVRGVDRYGKHVTEFFFHASSGHQDQAAPQRHRVQHYQVTIKPRRPRKRHAGVVHGRPETTTARVAVTPPGWPVGGGRPTQEPASVPTRPQVAPPSLPIPHDEDPPRLHRVPLEMAGKWIAWDPDKTRILGFGDTFSEARAAGGGGKDLILARVPQLRRSTSSSEPPGN